MVSLFARLRRWRSVGRERCSRFAVRVISLCLATVLIIAGIKLIFTR